MARVKSKDTRPEMAVRKLLFRLGFRYRLHARDLPGRPDIVFRGKRKVIFVHGCFWHLHAHCANNRPPKSRLDFWLPKLKSNKARDRKNRSALTRAGWKSLVLWECQVHDEPLMTARIEEFLNA
jgi:DNA mismatch endonuclease, patch repair protein